MHMTGPNWPSRRYELVVKKGTAPLGLKLHQTKSKRGEEWSMAAMVCGRHWFSCVCGKFPVHCLFRAMTRPATYFEILASACTHAPPQDTSPREGGGGMCVGFGLMGARTTPLSLPFPLASYNSYNVVGTELLVLPREEFPSSSIDKLPTTGSRRTRSPLS